MSLADDKFEKLCRELSEHRGTLGEACAAQFSSQQPALARQTAHLPLVHGMNDAEGLPDLQDVLGQSALLSAAARSPQGSFKDLERWLGLPDSVYTAAGVLYPQKNVALLFSASVEANGTGQASPWDSGAFGRHYGLKQASGEEREQHRELFHSYCLPAPLYRKYFCAYIATCFGNLNQYLYGQKNSFPDPLQMLRHDSFGSRVFEVRFPNRLAVTAKTLCAIFVRDKAGNENWISVKRRTDALAAQGVYVDYYPHNANLPKRIQDFICKALTSNA